MGRPKKSVAKHIEPEDESQDAPEEELEGGGQEGHGFAPADGDGPSKSEAARQAIKAGYDKPATALAWIKKTFGIEMGGQHFSAIKSQYLKKHGAPAKSEPAEHGPKPSAPLVEGYVAPPEKPKAVGEPDVLLALEGIKELVGQFGADRVKRMVDLIG